MTIPSFFLEISNKSSIPDSIEWGELKKNKRVFIKFKKNNINISFFNSNGNKLCILGNPIIDGELNNAKFAKFFFQNKNFDILKKINGEFLIFFINKSKKVLEIINSRFTSPALWYYLNKKRFLASLSFSELSINLKKNSAFKLNKNSFFEYLFFRRIFGNKSYELNTKSLGPASKLITNGFNKKIIIYWEPNFKNKINLSIDKSANLLIDLLLNSLKTRTSDNKKYGLFLSGGMDTRLLLSCLKKNNSNFCTLTFNSFINREVKIAKEAANIVNVKNIFIKNTENHYKKNFEECIFSTSSMYPPLTMFYGFSKLMKKYADIGIHGHGFDFFFQGMYLPKKRLKFLNHDLNFIIPRLIKGDLVNFFIKNVPYKTKSQNVLNFIKNRQKKKMMSSVFYELKKIEKIGKKLSNNVFELYEYLTFNNLGRHYSVSDNISINSIIETRIPAFDNELYDLYQSLPWQYRFDSKIQRLALKKINKNLANLKSANTNLPIKYSKYQKTFFQLINYFRNKFKGDKQDLEEKFQRMGLPYSYLLKNDWHNYLKDTISSNRLDKLDFLDIKKIKSYLNTVLMKKNSGHDTFTINLLCIDHFLKILDEN